jgi:1-acyl-sn-glycerol-3-phosphate acyltransferase
MACELEVPVVPVRVRGTFEALPKGRIWPRRHPVQVAFGAALRFEAATPYAEAADAIEAAVRAL